MMLKKLRVASYELRVIPIKSRVKGCASPANASPFARNSQLAPRPSSPKSTRNSPAFTFIEVLFAVILLGIGFIMIAGVFPVAIQQSAAVSNETQASLITRDAIRKIQAVADMPNATSLFTTTGTTAAPAIYAMTSSATSQSFLTATPPSNPLLSAITADALYSADKRYGWVAFYRFDSSTAAAGPAAGPFAQVYIVALQNSNFPNYLYTPAAGDVPAPVPPPVPPAIYGYSPPQTAQIQAQFFYNADGTTTVVLTYNTGTTPPQQPCDAPGAYLLIGGNLGGNPPPGMIGRFFRLGNPASSTVLPSGYTLPTGSVINEIYTLQSGSDLTPADAAAASPAWTAGNATAGFTANVFCIGRAPAADTTGGYTGPFTGPNQDIGATTAFIRVNLSKN